MKLKPLYMYGIIFVIIVAGIVITSSNNNEELTTTSNPMENKEMPRDAVHQGMNGMGEDAPSKTNVREDFWTKLEDSKAAYEANPNDTVAMKNYAQTLGMSHQTEQAIELYEKILAIDPSRIDILHAEGLAFYNNQNYQMSEVVTKKIIWSMSLAISIAGCAAPVMQDSSDTMSVVQASDGKAHAVDGRGRFREIYCAVNNDHGQELPDYRPCDEALVSVPPASAATGRPVNLGAQKSR